MFVEHHVRSISSGQMLASKYHLSPCVASNVVHSWAAPFREYVLKNIDEKVFKCLYSETDSRPNYPVRILLAFCILACYLKMTLKELHAELVTNMKVRFALGLMDYNPCVVGYEDMDPSEYCLDESAFDESDIDVCTVEKLTPTKYFAPFSLPAVQRFLCKCEAYYLLTGCKIDLIHIAMEDLFRKMAGVLEIDGKTVRIDSMMVASYTKKLSRKELLYVANAMHAKALNEAGYTLPEGLQHYLRKDDHNLVMYHLGKEEKKSSEGKKGKKSKETKESKESKESKEDEEGKANKEDEPTEDSITRLIREGQEILQFSYACKCGKTRDHKVHKRIMEEQLIDNGKGGLRLREQGEGMDSSLIQTPHDLDATYRVKNNKGYTGYCANLVEVLGGWGAMLISYDLEQNTYSDLKFYRNYLQDYVDLDRFNGIPENLDALPKLAELKKLSHDAEEARLQLEATQAENQDEQDQAQNSLPIAGKGQSAQAAGDAAASQTAPAAADVTEGQTAPAAADVAAGQTVPAAADVAVSQTAPSTVSV